VRVEIVTLGERPELADADFPNVWPEFLFHDAVPEALYEHLVAVYADFCLVALDGGVPVAKACAFPFTGDLAHLPDGGYDAVLLTAAADHLAGRRGNLVGAVEVAVQVDRRGTGLSALMLSAVRRNAARLGFADLVVALRPNHKHRSAETSLEWYVRQTRDDGLPTDPWLRTHIRAGGEILDVAKFSMTVIDTLERWRKWTGLPFDQNGSVLVPEALVPVHCDLANDRAVYIEPNIWIRHRLSERP
jgi:GNAT superfamily N-acetyltransferase